MTDNNSEQIRKWVAENFNDVGEFRTNDVMSNITGIEVRATGNVSAALQTWADDNRIISGYRLRRTSEKGKAAIWITEKVGTRTAIAASIEKPAAIAFNDTKPFVGEIIDTRGGPNGPSMLVVSGGKVYKVELLKY